MILVIGLSVIVGLRMKKNKKSGRQPKIMGEKTARVNFPLLPNSYHVKLEFQEEFLTDNATAGASDKWGLNHWAGRIPGYGSTFYSLYKYVQVLRVDYTFRISSTVATPFEAVLVPAPYQTSTTFDVLRAYRGRKLQTSSGLNSVNKILLRGSYYPSQVEGINTTYDKTTWYTESDSGTFAPLDTNTHGVWMAVRPVNTSTTGSYAVMVTIQYHCHFFSPINTALSLELGNSFVDCDREDEREQSLKSNRNGLVSLQKPGTSKMLKKV